MYRIVIALQKDDMYGDYRTVEDYELRRHHDSDYMQKMYDACMKAIEFVAALI